VAVREIIAREVLDDIRRGMSRFGLREKYLLSAPALEELLDVLMDVRAVSDDELIGELYFKPNAISEKSRRGCRRLRVPFETPVYDRSCPEIQGRVCDISDSGAGFTGIEAQVDEVRQLVILGDPFGEVNPIEFEAICRWATAGDRRGDYLTGFQITRIPEESLRELQRFLQLIESEVED